MTRNELTTHIRDTVAEAMISYDLLMWLSDHPTSIIRLHDQWAFWNGSTYQTLGTGTTLSTAILTAMEFQETHDRFGCALTPEEIERHGTTEKEGTEDVHGDHGDPGTPGRCTCDGTCHAGRPGADTPVGD